MTNTEPRTKDYSAVEFLAAPSNWQAVDLVLRLKYIQICVCLGRVLPDRYTRTPMNINPPPGRVRPDAIE